MPVRVRSIFLTWLVACAGAAALGAAYAWTAGGRPSIGALNGAVIGGLIAALELFVVERPQGRFLRALSLTWFIGVMTLIWMGLIVGVLLTANATFDHPWGATPDMHPHSSILKDALVVFAFGFLVMIHPH